MKTAIVATALVLLFLSVIRSFAQESSEPLYCSGNVGPIVCQIEYGPDPGPIEPLGYPTQEEAEANCSDGDVVSLYRQFVIVGWSCKKGQ